MKKLLFVLLLMPVICYSQVKHDNTILLPGNLTIKQITEVLFINGYNIYKQDSSYLATEEKFMRLYSIKIAIMKKDSVYYMKAQAKWTPETQGIFGEMNFTGIEFIRKMKKIWLDYSPWQEFDRVALLIDSLPAYTKQ